MYHNRKLKKKINCKDPIFKYFRVWRSPTSKTWLVGPTTCPSGVSLATGGVSYVSYLTQLTVGAHQTTTEIIIVLLSTT